jgi:hypothetical protein
MQIKDAVAIVTGGDRDLFFKVEVTSESSE